ncbi:hypothetical protein ABH975_000776 [Bradyrhizobium ottawaense]
MPAAISASSTGLAGVAQQQIGVADDAGADRRLAVSAACAHGGDAVGELDFADGPERFRPVRAIHRAAIDIDGRDDVVAGGDVGRYFLDQIAVAAIPEMVMGIDDRPQGINDRLLMQREPVLARLDEQPARIAGHTACSHQCPLPVVS